MDRLDDLLIAGTAAQIATDGVAYLRLVWLRVGIEQPSFIHASSQLGDRVYLGAFAYVGKNCRISYF